MTASNMRTLALNQPAGPEVYLPLWQNRAISKHLVVRTEGDPGAVAGRVREAIRAVDPSAAVENVKTMSDVRAESVASRVFAMQLLLGFSVVATLLALVGLYGVLSLSVGSRVKEMAVRKAIGAQFNTGERPPNVPYLRGFDSWSGSTRRRSPAPWSRSRPQRSSHSSGGRVVVLSNDRVRPP